MGRHKYNSHKEYEEAHGWIWRKPNDMKERRRHRRRQRRAFVRKQKEGR